MNASELNGLLRLGERRAERLVDPLAAIVRRVLDQAADDAARGFRRHAVDHLTAAAPGVSGQSTMVAVKPRPAEAALLEHDPGEPADTLHVTLVYLGETDEPLSALADVLAPVAAQHGALVGEVGGVGHFNDYGDGYPGILLPDVPGLVELRVAVCRALAHAGVAYARNHGFTPHLTVGYQGEEPRVPSRDVLGQALHFDELLLVRGDTEIVPLPLVGPKPVTAAGEPPTPSWAAPGAAEVLNVDLLVRRLRARTEATRSAVVETMMSPVLAGVGLSFDTRNPLTAKVLAQSGSQIQEIAETSQLHAMRVIRHSYEQGLSIPNTAKALRVGMKEANGARAVLIARTELVGAVNGGSLAAVRIVSDATGTPYWKRWLTAPFARYPRHTTYDGLGGQTRKLGEAFDVGGYALQHPGDPAGPPGEICNCRCTMVYTEDGPV